MRKHISINPKMIEYIAGILLLTGVLVQIPDMVKQYTGSYFILFIVVWFLVILWVIIRLLIIPMVNQEIDKVARISEVMTRIDDKAKNNDDIDKSPDSPPATVKIYNENDSLNKKNDHSGYYCPQVPFIPIRLRHIPSVTNNIKRIITKVRQGIKWA